MAYILHLTQMKVKRGVFMIKIIKNIRVYEPEYMGLCDVAIVGDKIAGVDKDLSFSGSSLFDIEVIDGTGKLIFPGFIDSHVHILGGGGEGGFKTRTPEITLTDITRGGVTTVVGCLGTDGISRNMISLLAKARGLEEEGITTYIYSGSYRVPVTTITGEIMKDIIAIDKVIGVGEVAISDHRSSHPSLDEIKKLVSDIRLGGILSGKAGVINFHVGDSMSMLKMVLDILESTEIPITQFFPTHMNRNPHLFSEAIRFSKNGGFVDFTTSSDPVFWEEGEVRAAKALKICLDEGVHNSKITFTSDGQGSLPVFDENKECIGLRVGKVATLYDEVVHAIVDQGIPIEKVLKVVTTNPASILKLQRKGKIKRGFDADLVLVDENSLKIDTVIAKGNVMVREGQPVVFGTFEK